LDTNGWACEHREAQLLVPLAIFLGHALLDFIKSRIKTGILGVFLLDQAAYIVLLVALSIWISGP
jgi:hypothetical protein